MREPGGGCPDDLLALGRQRALSDLEQRALAAHLTHCGLCRVGEVVATLLHAGQDELPGDTDILSRVADRVSAPAVTRPMRARRSWPRYALAGLVILCAGTGALAWIGRQRRMPSTESSPRPPHLEETARDRSRGPLGGEPQPPAPLDGVPVAEAAPLRPSKKRVSMRMDGSHGGPSDSLGEPPTAASLFTEANATRSAGDLRRAVGLYQVLRRQFPDSAEAHLSSISLGDLLWDLRAPIGALDAFDSYLAEMPVGSLREEALFGRARCLRRLGRNTAEEETWNLLVREFPRSAYEQLARQRISELRQ